MTETIFPHAYRQVAVRLLGFDSDTTSQLVFRLAAFSESEIRYFVLEEDNLQDPEVYVVNGDSAPALAQLKRLSPGPLRPALVIGKTTEDVPYRAVPDSSDGKALIEALNDLTSTRDKTVEKLKASKLVSVPERRRRTVQEGEVGANKLVSIRTSRPWNGIAIVVDKAPTLVEHLRTEIGLPNLRVNWVNSESAALSLNRDNPASIVIINTSAPDIDPYRLCMNLKDESEFDVPAVIFLVRAPFVYETARARAAGVDGFLRKPLETQHIVTAIRKLVPQFY